MAAVLLRGEPLQPSENDYDWLGRGIYFWEHGPQRALATVFRAGTVTRIAYPAPGAGNPHPPAPAP